MKVMYLLVDQEFLNILALGNLNTEKCAIQHEILECEPVSLHTQIDQYTSSYIYFLCVNSEGFVY